MPRELKLPDDAEEVQSLLTKALAALEQLGEKPASITAIAQQGGELHITLYGGRMVVWPPRGVLSSPRLVGEGQRQRSKQPATASRPLSNAVGEGASGALYRRGEVGGEVVGEAARDDVDVLGVRPRPKAKAPRAPSGNRRKP